MQTLQELAYSGSMEAVLLFLSCANTVLCYFLVTDLALTICGESVDLKRRFAFTFVSGMGLNSLWIYAVFLIGGMKSFSPLVYSMVTIPNPIFYLLIYYFGIKILKLSPYRSLHVAIQAYMYFIIGMIFNKYIASIFFVQTSSQYNYLLDIKSIIVCSAINVLLYKTALALFKKYGSTTRVSERLFFPPLKLEIAKHFFIACIVYLIVVLLQYLIPNNNNILLALTLILGLCIVVGILKDSKRAADIELENKDSYIKSLTKSLDEFSSLKHEFYNILQTYSGFILFEDMASLRKYHELLLNTTISAGRQVELNQRMHENPTLVSLLLGKMTYAGGKDINMIVNLNCGLQQQYIDNVDFCRSISCLLDNAIEFAAGSQKKRVYFSIEKKRDVGRLIIVTGSMGSDVDSTTAGSAKEIGENQIRGLAALRETLDKYSKCALRLSFSPNEFSAYIDIRQ